LLDPDWGGWHTVVTAVSAEVLATSARTLNWQTQSPVRIVDPEGMVVQQIESPLPEELATPRAGT
jgi:hypothetical protein